MKLLAKFNLILGLVFAAGLGITGYVARQFLRENAREDVIRQARLMMEAASSTRNYTTKQIKPLLAKQQDATDPFLPQTVPAFAATESFAYLHSAYPDYSYKEAALNPTNPRDRASDWEADVIHNFRDHRAQKEMVGERDTPSGRSLYLAKPIAALAPCLECHDTPQFAPPAMVRRYGSSNGFGWQGNEIIGAQIVSVPEALPLKMADNSFNTLMASVAVVFVCSLVLLDLALALVVVRPLRRVSAQADEISTGNMKIPELQVSGKDEVAILAGSFNRMRRSLERALKMLEGE